MCGVNRKSKELLPQPDAQIFCDFYGVLPEGNAPREGDPHGEFKGKNILMESGELPVIAKMNGVTHLREATDKLASAREILFEARKSRPRPHRDDKIIVAWNGLMISAFARAAVAFGTDNRYARAAGGRRRVRVERIVGRREFAAPLERRRRRCARVLRRLRRFGARLFRPLRRDFRDDVGWSAPKQLADRMSALFLGRGKGGAYLQFFARSRASWCASRKITTAPNPPPVRWPSRSARACFTCWAATIGARKPRAPPPLSRRD